MWTVLFILLGYSLGNDYTEQQKELFQNWEERKKPQGSTPTVTMIGLFVLSCAKSEAFSMHNNVRTANTHVCYASGKDGLDDSRTSWRGYASHLNEKFR